MSDIETDIIEITPDEGRRSDPVKGSPKVIHQQSSGQLHVVTGPMYSGKTSRLNSKLTEIADSIPSYKVLRISYAKDVRITAGVDVENCITSHSSSFRGLTSKIDVQIVSELDEVVADGYDVIGVDEAQFYKGLKNIVIEWLNQGKMIYLSSLDAYSNGELCGEITSLLPEAKTFVKVTATCKFCIEQGIVREAIKTASLVEKKDDVQIGGEQIYSPACLDCHRIHSHG